MKQFTIPAKKHRARPLQLKLWWKKSVIHKMVVFDITSKYDIGPVDQSDWNKLFGIGYFFSHHKNSARFVWRYNPDKGLIEIGYYVYANGHRISGKLLDVPLNRKCVLRLSVDDSGYSFDCWNENNVFITGKFVKKGRCSHLSYALGGYFGGNQTAPHRINYSMKNYDTK